MSSVLIFKLEPLTRVELVTPSLPRKCSTTELQRLVLFEKSVGNLFFHSVSFFFHLWSGRRGSNPPPIAWKAIALPNELLPPVEVLAFVGEGGLEPPNSSEDRFTVCCNCHYATSPTISSKHESRWRDSNPRQADYKSATLAI